MTTAPDQLAIGLTDGMFYGGDPFPAFAWMRDHAPAYFDESSGSLGDHPLCRHQGDLQGSRYILQCRWHSSRQRCSPDDDRYGRPRARAPTAPGQRGIHPASDPRERRGDPYDL